MYPRLALTNQYMKPDSNLLITLLSEMLLLRCVNGAGVLTSADIYNNVKKIFVFKHYTYITGIYKIILSMYRTKI